MCLPVKPYKVEREWKHAGLSCAVTQSREGRFRCGYVRVPPSHPLHGKRYSDMETDLDVHGGLTFSNMEPCTEHEDGQGWWFGFDCGHWGDATYDFNDPPEHQKHFWSKEEVVMETNRLAEQLASTTNSN